MFRSGGLPIKFRPQLKLCRGHLLQRRLVDDAVDGLSSLLEPLIMASFGFDDFPIFEIFGGGVRNGSD